jgi:hypothetical protein
LLGQIGRLWGVVRVGWLRILLEIDCLWLWLIELRWRSLCSLETVPILLVLVIVVLISLGIYWGRLVATEEGGVIASWLARAEGLSISLIVL